MSIFYNVFEMLLLTAFSYLIVKVSISVQFKQRQRGNCSNKRSELSCFHAWRLGMAPLLARASLRQPQSSSMGRNLSLYMFKCMDRCNWGSDQSRPVIMWRGLIKRVGKGSNVRTKARIEYCTCDSNLVLMVSITPGCSRWKWVRC